MKLYRFLIAAVAILLVGGIVFFAWCVHARMVKMEYEFEVDAVLAACSVANGGEPVTDPALAVISSFDGRLNIENPKMIAAISKNPIKVFLSIVIYIFDYSKCVFP